MKRLILTVLTLVTLMTLIRVDAQDAATRRKLVTDKLGDKLGGGSRDLNPAVKLSNRPVSSRQVLVYYVNEPHTAVYRKLQQLLKSQEGDVYQNTASRIESDLKQFPEAIEAEMATIQEQTPNHIGAVLFTNQMARDGQCLVHRIGTDEFARVDFSFEPPKQLDMQHHPLTAPDTFAAAMRKIEKLFPPAEHSYVLITKSHGTTHLAMATLLGQVMGVTNAEELKARLAEVAKIQGFEIGPGGKLVPRKDGSTTTAEGTLSKTDDLGPGDQLNKLGGKEDETPLGPGDNLRTLGGLENETPIGNGGDLPTLSPDVESTLSPDGNPLTLGEGMASDTLGEGMQSDTLGGEDTLAGGKILVTGLTKADLYKTLKLHARESGLYIPLYFAEACRSEVTRNAILAVTVGDRPEPEPIGTLFASNATGLRYTTIDYNKVFARISDGDTLVNAMFEHLSEVQKTQIPIPGKKEPTLPEKSK